MASIPTITATVKFDMDKRQASFQILLSLVTGVDIRNVSDNDIERYAETSIKLAEELHEKLKDEE